jgi:hypothetical protein
MTLVFCRFGTFVPWNYGAMALWNYKSLGYRKIQQKSVTLFLLLI